MIVTSQHRAIATIEEQSVKRRKNILKNQLKSWARASFLSVPFSAPGNFPSIISWRHDRAVPRYESRKVSLTSSCVPCANRAEPWILSRSCRKPARIQTPPCAPVTSQTQHKKRELEQEQLFCEPPFWWDPHPQASRPPSSLVPSRDIFSQAQPTPASALPVLPWSLRTLRRRQVRASVHRKFFRPERSENDITSEFLRYRRHHKENHNDNTEKRAQMLSGH